MTKLKDLAKITSGATEARYVPKDEIPFIKMKDIDHAHHSLKWSEVTPSGINLRDDKKLLNNGDIIIVCKGTNNTAVLINDIKEPSVASNHFFIVRLNSQGIDPSYIIWFLNNPAKEYLENNATGTTIRNITLPVIGNLEVPVPPITVQKSIVEIYDLMKKEQKLAAELADSRKVLMNAIFAESIATL